MSSTNLQVACVVAFYMCAALVMVFVNKTVMNNEPDLPLVFLLLQLVIAVVLLHVSALASKSVEIPKITLDAAKKLFPVVFVNITGLTFNLLCLRGVEATFFQIARGLVLPLTILCSWMYDPTSGVSKNVITASAIVTGGFFLGVLPNSTIPATSTPSFISLFYGVLSSLFIAVHAVLIKISLPYCQNSTIQLAWWTNAGSALLLLPVVAVTGEISVLQGKIYDSQWNGNTFLYGSLITGVFGFLLCLAGLLSIRVTSPVTHMFSSAARSVLQTIIGVAYFGDLININRATSILVILGGTMFYTWIKSAEAKKQPPADIEAFNGAKTEREAQIKE
ncbi:TPT domain-containing protein [Mycena indigotica]|uniref:TPT domain-containing protein n=1 Tax=Mycena indigotica TaxID=2126181 RepID=A0A8H6SY81_9AGAR|nr:TPT domain-containing protein [Mycena indigotica]KAF7307350.1 TPT domain-containing protein [Mycena indigotica]